MIRKFYFICLFLFLCLTAGWAQSSDSATLTEDPPLSITQHSVRVNGQTINYTATTGYLVLREENGDARARMFLVAYTRNDVSDLSERPITYTFNGGPGSSSVWLHMGALGPRRILMTEEGESLPPPYELVDNEYTWLDKTDLLFIDPVETGFSRPAEGVDKKEFTGFEEDIASVGDFIRLYTTRFNRWSSPKFIAGESYGTTRAAGAIIATVIVLISLLSL